MEKNKYKIINRVQETHDTVTLKLERGDGQTFSYVPGQFITVYFPETGTPEGKSYSLSSAPHEGHFSITVKAMGEFSNRLYDMEKGQTILASPPYGFFFSESTDSDMVFLAAGIGIAPFRGMIADSLAKNSSRKIILNYSVRTEADIIFKKELEKINNPNFKVNYFITREGSHERMKPQHIIQTLPSLKNPEFFICGSIAFVRDMWRGLQENGVPEDMIYTEAFFSH